MRALTRAPEAAQAQGLAARGAEVVCIDMDRRETLPAAFEGCDALFVVTAYWPAVAKLGRDGAGRLEVEQFKKIAWAAARTPTLRHLVLSTLPGCDKMSAGRFHVPHYDYKQRAVDWMRDEYPELLAMTTEFWPGWYTSNLVNLAGFAPMPPTPGAGRKGRKGSVYGLTEGGHGGAKGANGTKATNGNGAEKSVNGWNGWHGDDETHHGLVEVEGEDEEEEEEEEEEEGPDKESYLFALPAKPDSLLPIAGEVETNAGVVVEAILRAGARAHGKIVILVTEYRSVADVASTAARITGKRIAYAEIPDAHYGRLYGGDYEAIGLEMASRMRWSEVYPDWHAFEPERVMTFADLGIEGQLVGFEEAVERIKDKMFTGLVEPRHD